MNDRLEPTISSLPLDREEQARSRVRPAGPTATFNNPSLSSPPPISSRPVIVRSPLTPLALVLALAACGFGGYLFWQMQLGQQRFAATSLALTAAEARIAELEKKLTVSDDESSQSMAALQSNIKDQAAEIRKLWSVNNEKNRPAIAKLEENVAKLEKSLAGVDPKIQAAVAEVAGEIKVQSELLDAQQAVLNNADQGVKEQTKAVKALASKIDGIDSSLRRQIQGHEEAIRAFDAFRLQVNRDLLKAQGAK